MVHMFRKSTMFQGHLKTILLFLKKHENIMGYDSQVTLIFIKK